MKTRAIIATIVAAVVLIGGWLSVYFIMKSDFFVHQRTTYEVVYDLQGNELSRTKIGTYDDIAMVIFTYVAIAILAVAVWMTIYYLIGVYAK